MTPAPRIIDQFGRYLIKPGAGAKAVPYTRATTISSTLDDRYALENWAKRHVARGLALRPDILAMVAASDDDDKAQLDSLCKQALEAAAGSAGANLGNALHEATARLDQGGKVSLPAPLDIDLEVYQKALADHGVAILPGMVERVVVLDQLEVAGTFDRLVDFGSTPKVMDLKTGRSLDFSWPSIAIQLALYAHADALYDPASGKREPMPDVDQESALIVHLPAGRGRCDLYWVDIAAGWEAAQHAMWARGWRKRKDLAQPWRDNEVVAVVDVRRARLQERIDVLRPHPIHMARLAALWPAGVAAFKHSADHTGDELDAIARVLGQVEGEFRLPFGPLDPADGTVAPPPPDVALLAPEAEAACPDGSGPKFCQQHHNH